MMIEPAACRPPSDVIQRFRATGLWGEMTLDQRFRENVRHRPNRLAIADPPDRASFTDGDPARLTYDALDAEIDRAVRLIRSYGVERGDRVAIQLPNIREGVILLLACQRMGAVASPILVQFDAELSFIIGLLRPRLLFAGRVKSRDLAALAADVCAAHGCAVVRISDGIPDALEARVATTRPPAPDADDPATICWTSGTEGRPKGVVRTSNHWLVTGRIMFWGARLADGDVILNLRPMVNMAAIGGGLMSWLMTAGTLILHHPLDMDLAIAQIRDERVTVAFMPPTFFVTLMNDPALVAAADLSSLRLIGTGSAAVPAGVIAGFEDAFGVEVLNFFGSNEGAGLISGRREVPDPSARASLFPRFGREEFDWPSFPPATEFRTALIDPGTGLEILEPGAAGELRIDGPGIFSGYFGDPSLTQAAFDDHGRFMTGDLFEIAGSGELSRFYRFVGRRKEIISRGGMKIAPAELDGVMAGFADAGEAAFFGYPDDRLGEKVGVAIVPRDGRAVTLDAVILFLRSRRIAVFKLPERLLLLDALPRNAMMKVQRDALTRLSGQGGGSGPGGTGG